eukprot:GHVS01004744.1.p1 GENE.GHVS01004744.1~~GHVS01004744.1.p1  ORF type:complete len:461 (-),score=109.17 GHVS01004744.1:75-1457(-)
MRPQTPYVNLDNDEGDEKVSSSFVCKITTCTFFFLLLSSLLILVFHHSWTISTPPPSAALSTDQLISLSDDACLPTHHHHPPPAPWDPLKCLGAPFLYLTFHGGPIGSGRAWADAVDGRSVVGQDRRVRNVCQYSRDGCVIGSVLLPSPVALPLVSLRGMLLQDDLLYVADAYKGSSRILVYGKPDNYSPSCRQQRTKQNDQQGGGRPKQETAVLPQHHRRGFVRILTQHDDVDNPGLLHPYSIANDASTPTASPYLYVSAQGTSEVLRYDLTSGGPASTAGGSSGRLKEEEVLDPGVFVQLSTTKQGKQKKEVDDSIRGICFDGFGNLYIADKQRGVIVVNGQAEEVGLLPVESPISVFFDKDRSSVWAGCSNTHSLLEFVVSARSTPPPPPPRLVQTITHPWLRHPAGFTSYGDSLFVVSQNNYKILEFSKNSGKLINVVISDLPDDAERILLTAEEC